MNSNNSNILSWWIGGLTGLIGGTVGVIGRGGCTGTVGVIGLGG